MRVKGGVSREGACCVCRHHSSPVAVETWRHRDLDSGMAVHFTCETEATSLPESPGEWSWPALTANPWERQLAQGQGHVSSGTAGDCIRMTWGFKTRPEMEGV